MFMVNLFSWWYLRGYRFFIDSFKQKLQDSADFFSFGQLFGTLFMPFRQISSSGEQSSFSDRLVSRVVGFFARFFIIIFGAIAILFETLFGLILILLWPFFPLLFLAGIILTFIGGILL